MQSNKTHKIFVLVGLSLLVFQVGVLAFGMPSTQNASLTHPITYELAKDDHVSWGIFDIYKDDSGVEIESYKSVLDFEILAVDQLELDNDTEDDIVAMSRLILGSLGGIDLNLPMYVDIYTISWVLLGVRNDTAFLPDINAMHVISSSAVRSLEEALTNATAYTTTEELLELTSLMSFLHVGILPSGFNYTLLWDLFQLLNNVTNYYFGFPVFQITNNTKEFRVSINEATFDDLADALPAYDVSLMDAGARVSFTMCWDKRVNLLNESICTMVYQLSAGTSFIRTFGTRLVRTTMQDAYPNTLSSSDFSIGFDASAEVTSIKVALFAMVGVSVAIILAVVFKPK